MCSPSISDKTRAGYFSQDCASQTEKSDVVNLKEVTHMVQILVKVILLIGRTILGTQNTLRRHLPSFNQSRKQKYIRAKLTFSLYNFF